jgi:hypothetical protein
MEDWIIFGFQAIAWLFVNAGHFIIPLLIGSCVFYCWASVKDVVWAVTWDEKQKGRVEASQPKSKKKEPKSSQTVVSTYSDEYKLPQLPFS